MNLLKINDKDKILIVAPHPDDETIGCGGLLVKYGRQCDVLLVTDGRMGFEEKSSVKEPDKMAEIRKKEFLSVMEKLGVNKTVCLDLPNEGLNKNNLKKLKKFNLDAYTKVFIPGEDDGHHEHIAVNKILRKMLNRRFCKAKIFEYEVWKPLSSPTHLLDISDVIDSKLEAVAMYKSQLECYDYPASCKGLNLFRGSTHHIAYAEMYCYRQTARNFLINIKRKLTK